MLRFFSFCILITFLASCAPQTVPSARLQVPDLGSLSEDIPPGFHAADGSRSLSFPEDFGAHEEFRTEWWYYTGNLQTAEPEGRRFGFELTIFRVGLLPPTVELPDDSLWYSRSLYFAHFAVSDIAAEEFYAFERYSRPGPGLAGAQSNPYRVWIEDWSISGQQPGSYRLQAAESEIAVDLILQDEMGVVLHGEHGYSRKGDGAGNASYYYSQPRLAADGFIQIKGSHYAVRGLAWKDHEFSTGVLDSDQIGWDWFSLQFEDGRALMLFQLRERDGDISPSSSATLVSAEGSPRSLSNTEFTIRAGDTWQSPHTNGVYPAAWEIRLEKEGCVLDVRPWMPDQELNFRAVTYWEGAVHFEGTCQGTEVRGNGYVELTGYAGNLPLP